MVITSSLVRIFHLFTLLILGMIVSCPLLAAQQKSENWYEIELIVFAQDMANNFDSEVWEEKPGTPKTHSVVELYSTGELLLEDYIKNLPLYLIEPEENINSKMSLEKNAKKLRKSEKYQLLIHRIWRQPLKKFRVYLSDSPNTDPIMHETQEVLPQEADLTQEKSPEEMLMQTLLKEENKNTPLNQIPFSINERDSIQNFDDVRDIPDSQNTALSYEGPPQHLVYGHFTLSKGRYLHMDLDFLYRGEPYVPMPEEEPVDEEIDSETTNPEITENMGTNEEDPENIPVNEEDSELSTELPGFIGKEAPPLVGFRIKESKRVRLNNVYYFDHPLFGIISRISRYTPSEEETKKIK